MSGQKLCLIVTSEHARYLYGMYVQKALAKVAETFRIISEDSWKHPFPNGAVAEYVDISVFSLNLRNLVVATMFPD